MLEKLTALGEQIALEAQARQIRRLFDQFSGRFGARAVSSDETRLLVTGRGIIKRWLVDPSLRFLAGEMR